MGTGTSRSHEPDRAGLGERVAGMVEALTSQFVQRVDDRGLVRLGDAIVVVGQLLVTA